MERPVGLTLGTDPTSDWVMRTVIQASSASPERLVEGIRKLGYEGKRKERLAHPQNELQGAEVMNRGDRRSETVR